MSDLLKKDWFGLGLVIILGSISKKLDILVIGDSKPTKKKIDSAKKLNIKTIKELEWYKLLDL